MASNKTKKTYFFAKQHKITKYVIIVDILLVTNFWIDQSINQYNQSILILLLFITAQDSQSLRFSRFGTEHILVVPSANHSFFSGDWLKKNFCMSVSKNGILV